MTLWLPPIRVVRIYKKEIPITNIIYHVYSTNAHSSIVFHNRNSRGVLKMSKKKYYPT